MKHVLSQASSIMTLQQPTFTRQGCKVRFLVLCYAAGLQVILPDYLKEGFVQAALSYIACNGEGAFVCRDTDCWCKCDAKFPECNCPYMDIQAMEESLQRITETWGILYKEFEDSGKYTSFNQASRPPLCC